MEEKDENIFNDLAGGNPRLVTCVARVRALWQRHAKRRTKAIVVICVGLGVFCYFNAVKAPDNFPINTLVTVSDGQAFSQVADSLEQQSVVRNAFAFRILGMLYGAESSVQSGDYLFKKQENLLEVLKRLSSGTFGLEPVTVRVREGSTVADIAELLESKMLAFDKEHFLAVASKSEGYLFPDTYYFLPNAKADKIVAAMKDNFYTHYKEIELQAQATDLSQHEVVTLASIVELEAYKYEDRRKIAGVMYNRLAINMPLQVDVSFVYIMNKGTFDITREDLRHDSPYNSYRHKGLPPGPIGSPSLASLRAVVDPVESEWIFYLADSGGTTHFSTTYKQHLVKKRRYIDNR